MTVRTDAPELSGRSLVVTRVLDAPRDLVFAVWTDPSHLARWWGPNGFTNPVCEVDLRPGGSLRIDMRAPDGTVIPVAGEIREVVPPERLVFTTSGFADADGRPQVEILHTVTLVEQAGKTTLTLHASVIRATPAMAAGVDGMEAGWSQSLDRFVAEVARSAAARA